MSTLLYRHSHEKHIQISGSASLYYVVKSESLKRDWNVKVKRKILSTLLNGMLIYREDPTMMRNGCLTLCQFQIPADVLFDYERLVRIHIILKYLHSLQYSSLLFYLQVKILLHIVSEHTSEENNFIQRAGIFLLNSLACQVLLLLVFPFFNVCGQVDGQQKMLVGSLGAMEKMLLIITDKLQQGVSTVGNIIVCHRFLSLS